MRCRSLRLSVSARLVLLLGLGAAACAGSGGSRPGDTQFESDLPAGSNGRSLGGPGGRATSQDAAAGVPGLGPKAGAASSDAARVISEADIIQVQADYLYALSRTAGLAVIDVSHPDALRIVGRYRELPAEPFEMYLREGVALVMFSGWGQYVVRAEGDYQWVTTSKLVALDVSDAAQIKSVGSFDVPGSISDSRIVGNVLYIIGHQDGYCWGCKESVALTSILSLDVSDPRKPVKVDELAYEDGNQTWGPRSVTVTDRRMYVGGPEYGKDMPTGSTIQVVDISDAKGTLAQGTTVAVQGQISSRWQMDEDGGVLRVISQPPQWWNGPSTQTPRPSVQTFKVTSSTVIEPLGQTDIVLPMRETLRSVRFDGPRAYAITAEQKDPLFTIDLSDPVHPRQVGELQMPGFVYYMEPRGDRLLGLGFDQGNPEGSITVSLFDVKNLAKPQLLSRVNFGGSWGSLPADQDRIHKVFRVLDDVGLILVPFSGWEGVDLNNSCKVSGYVGGVQLIDFSNDALHARGAAPGFGETRRALLHGGSLLTVSDERVQGFDVSDRSTPKLLSKVELASNVQRALQLANGTVARIAYDPNRGVPVVDLVAAQDAGDPNASYGEIDLSSLTESSTGCGKSVSFGEIFVSGSELDIMYDSYDSGAKLGGMTAGLLVIDTSDPQKPRIVSNTDWNNDGNWYAYSSSYGYGYYYNQQPALRTAHTISMLESSSEYTGVRSIQKTRLRVLDLRNPESVKVNVLSLTSDESYAGLIADGDTLYTTHFTETDPNSGRARFFVDRLDVSNPTSPRRLDPINVPGQLVYRDHGTGRLLTNELVRKIVRDVTYEECHQRFAYADFVSNDANGASGTTTVSVGGAGTAKRADSSGSSGDGGTDLAAPSEPPPSPKGICTGFQQRLHLLAVTNNTATLEDTITLDEKKQLLEWSPGDGVVFGTVGHGDFYGIGLLDCFGPCGGVPPQEPVELWALAGFGSGKLEQGSIHVENQSNAWSGFWGAPTLYAHGKKALLLSQSEIAIIDASRPSAPKLERTVPLIASAQYVDMREDTALLTLGAQGVQWLSLK